MSSSTQEPRSLARCAIPRTPELPFAQPARDHPLELLLERLVRLERHRHGILVDLDCDTHRQVRSFHGRVGVLVRLWVEPRWAQTDTLKSEEVRAGEAERRTQDEHERAHLFIFLFLYGILRKIIFMWNSAKGTCPTRRAPVRCIEFIPSETPHPRISGAY